MQSLILRAFWICLITISTGSHLMASDTFTVLASREEASHVPNLRRIRMVDKARGWTADERDLWFTDDGAKTWRNATSFNSASRVSTGSWGIVGNGQAWAVEETLQDHRLYL